MSVHSQPHTYSRRVFLKLAGGAAGALARSACVPAASAGTAPDSERAPVDAEEETVLWWRSLGGSVGELLDKFAADFSADNNGITIQAEYQGDYVEHMNKIIAAAAANALPDMILVGDGQYPPLARNGILLALDDLIAGPNGLDLTEYKEPINRGIID